MDEKDYAARVRNLKASRFLYRADVIARVESIICVDSDFDKFCILVYWNLPNIYCKLMFILGKTIIVKRIICSNSGIF